MQLAAWYLLASLGPSGYESIPNTVNNARFCDVGFQCDADTSGNTLQLGVGRRLGSWAGLNWSVEGAYTRTGTMKLYSQFPADHDYDVPTGTCLQNCDPEDMYHFRGDWHANSGTVSLLAAYPMNRWSVYGKLGAIVSHIDGSAAVGLPGQGKPMLDMSIPGPDHARVQGWRMGVTYGIGASYDEWRVKPFIEVNQTRTSGQGYPGFQTWHSLQVGVRVEL